MQPMPLCIPSNRALEDAYANTPQRSVKQMQPMWLCKPTIGNLRAHLKIHRRYIVKQVLLYVALIPSCKHLCIRIDCKSEFIPMSAFLCVTSLNFHEQIWTHTFGITIRLLHVWIWEVLPNFPWLAFYCHKCCIGYFVLHVQSSRERIR